VKIIIEEFNIIRAALRRTEMAYGTMEARARENKNHREAAACLNNVKVCKNIADKWEERGPGALDLRRSEFDLIIRVLRTTAGASDDVAARMRRDGKFLEARQQEIFGAGCRTVADKWQREGFSDRPELVN
jgi:hypothetical protein